MSDKGLPIKTRRGRIHVEGRRFLFGLHVNEGGFITDGGQVLLVKKEDVDYAP